MRRCLSITIGVLLVLANFSWGATTYAQQTPDQFLVTIEPSSFDLNSPVDMTIKAVKANGEVVKDYQGDVFIDVAGSLDTTDYTVPSEGLYTFKAQDQGAKTFSKGLSINKVGTYTVTVSDISNDTIKGEKSVIVWGKASANTDTKTITFTSPIKWGTEKNEVLEVMGSSPSLPNSPLELYLNDQLVYQATTTSDGSFTAYITGLQKGANTLQAKILDANNTVLGESEILSFNYESAADGTFQSIQVLPSNTVKTNTKATFNVTTSDTVTSVTLKFSNGRSTPMDLQSAGTFSKEFSFDTEGKVDVSLELMAAGQKKSYDNVTSIIVEKGTKVTKVRVFSDSAFKNKINLTWDVDGKEPAKYNVLYGKQKESLNESVMVTKKEITLEDLEVGQVYYFKIVPLDANGQEAGTASDIIQATIGDTTDTACTVQGIQIIDQQIDGKYYLTRNTVQNIEKYIIYRSDWQTSDVSKMQKVGETTETKYEYPFNKSAKQDKYSYYAVQALCKDGKAIVINDIKKVKTGPVENTLLFVFVTLFLYSSYRLYLFNKE